MRSTVSLLLLTLTLNACTAEHLPPALPDAKMVPDEPPRAIVQTPPVPEPPPALLPLPRIMEPPPPKSMAKKGPSVLRERPEAVMAQANKAALIAPERKGYFGESAVQRYIYQPGKVYLVISSPQHPTTLFLPPGERLAAAPVIDPEAWEVSATEMAGEGHRVEAIMIRPFKPSLESTLPLLTQGGRAYFCRIRSQESLGMVAVTWELPTVQVIEGETSQKPKKLKAPVMHTPTISLERLHTGYNIEVMGKYRPAWMPQSVLDDGSKTVIRFQEPLGFTNAPAVFTLHPDKTPGIVEFSTYSNPEHPEQGLYYIVQGLWPELRLRGTDQQEVKIVRSTSVR
jgi:type IV secretory pathway VirB9-like protein